MKAGYLKELARKGRVEEDLTIEFLPTAKRGRPLRGLKSSFRLNSYFSAARGIL